VFAEVLAPGCARMDVLLSGRRGKIQVSPPKWVTGNVRAADTDKPVAGVEIDYLSRFSPTDVPGHRPQVALSVGGDGSFRVPVPSEDYAVLYVQPPVGARLRPLLQLVDLDGQEQADVQFSLASDGR